MTTPHKPRTLQDIRKAELAQIHLAKKQLGWDDDTYRATIRLVSGGATDSSGKLDIKQRKMLLDRMKASGFQVRHARKAPLKTKAVISVGDDRDQVKKIRHLWLDLHAFGAVRDNSERALASYVKRITGKEHPRFLDLDEASNVIETLKKWQARTRVTPFIELLKASAKMRASIIIGDVYHLTGVDIGVCAKDEWDNALNALKQDALKRHEGVQHGG